MRCRHLLFIPIVFLALLPVSVIAQVQSHPLSQVTPIDANLAMNSYNISGASYLLYNTGIIAGGTRGIPSADIQASAVTGSKISAGAVGTTQLSNPIGGSLNASAYYDSDNSNYFLDAASTGSSLVVAGRIGIGTAQLDAPLTILSDAAEPVWIYRSNLANNAIIHGAIRLIGLTNNSANGTAGFGLSLPFNLENSMGSNVEFGGMGVVATDAIAGAENGAVFFYTRKNGVLADAESTERMRITSSGYIGINTTTPANTLNVIGDINATGTIYGTVSGTISGNATGLTCTGCVGTNELASSAVTSSKIASGAVGSSQLANPIGGSLNATMYYDSDNSVYYLDAAGTGTALSIAGNIVMNNKEISGLITLRGNSGLDIATGDTSGGIGIYTKNTVPADTLRMAIGYSAAQGSAGITTYEPLNFGSDSSLTGANTQIIRANSGGLYFNVPTGANYSFNVNTAEQVRITNTGSVGIGTTNPNWGKLDVVGTGNFRDSASTPAYGVTIEPSSTIQKIFSNYNAGSDTPLVLGTYANRANQLYLKTDGNVGIGTTTPADKLEVAGNLNVSSGYARIKNSATGNPVLILRDNAYPNGWGLKINPKDTGSGYAWYFNTTAAADDSIVNNILTLRQYDASGSNDYRVGIGTTDPGTTLHVTSGNAELLRLQTSATTGSRYIAFYNSTGTLRSSVGYDYPSDALFFGYDGGIGMYVKQAGNVTLSSQASLGTGYKLCLNGETCTVYTYYNGTCVITKGPTSQLAVC